MSLFEITTRPLFPLTLVAVMVFAGCSGSPNDPNFDASVSDSGYGQDGPRVLFDEGHRNLHEAGGTYQPFVRLLEADGYRVETTDTLIDEAMLANAEVLVIVNPRGTTVLQDDSAFSQGEIDAIAKWVEQGGRLLLIADHFPFGGAAQNLSGAFGVEMDEGLVEDPTHHASDLDSSHIEFSQVNGLLGSHPIIEGRNPAEELQLVVTFTGQSLSVPPNGVGLLNLSGDAVDLEASPVVEESGDDVIVTVDFVNPTSAEGRVQGVAITHGSGRVVILGEAAMFTAQVDNGQLVGMNLGDTSNKQFALNIMHWLSGILN